MDSSSSNDRKDYHSVAARDYEARFWSSPDATAGWEEISDAARERGEQAKVLFEQFRKECEANRPPSQIPDARYASELLGPDHHLVEKIWAPFRRHVKTFPGWSANRREATLEERQLYRLKSARKAYFVNVVYQEPLNDTPLVFAMGERLEAYPVYRNSYALDGYAQDSYTAESRYFSKSANSAFSPASTRPMDSTMVAEEALVPDQCRRSLFQSARADTNSFVPVAPPSANFEPTSLSICRLPALFSGISLEILQVVPQQVFPGGFVYGDVVSFAALTNGPRVRAIVIGAFIETETNDNFHGLVVKTSAMENHVLAPADLTLVQEMPRWNSWGGMHAAPSVVESANPPLDGRSHVPK
jgi:hypothetical protein